MQFAHAFQRSQDYFSIGGRNTCHWIRWSSASCRRRSIRTKKSNNPSKGCCTLGGRALSDNEKNAVRFGLFPREKMAAAEKEGYDGHELAIALMDCATKDGGMRG